MKTPTTVLLVVIAALLAANLFGNLPPQEARAQPSLRVAEVPHVIQVEVGLSPAGINARDYRLKREAEQAALRRRRIFADPAAWSRW